MCLLMHLFYTARDITSHALGTIASAMGPCGVLGALGTSTVIYLLLQLEDIREKHPLTTRFYARALGGRFVFAGFYTRRTHLPSGVLT